MDIFYFLNFHKYNFMMEVQNTANLYECGKYTKYYQYILVSPRQSQFSSTLELYFAIAILTFLGLTALGSILVVRI